MTMRVAVTDHGLDEMLKAVANPVRRKMLRDLKDPERHFPGQAHPYELGVCAGRIDDACGLSQSTISAHLAVLQSAGLVTARRVGPYVFYKRHEAAVAEFLQQLDRAL